MLANRVHLQSLEHHWMHYAGMASEGERTDMMERSDDRPLIEWYEDVTMQTGLYPEAGTGSLVAITYCMLGLGEAGEAQGKLKKVWRGDKTLEQQREALLDECGDVLWYLTRAAMELGGGLQELIERNGAKVLDRKARGQTRGEGDNR
jgi:NTP pyrophosphatase (non-canonical NTP hydrolase)